MNTRKNQKQQNNDDAPASIPQTTPSNIGYGSQDHSFTLQAIMELQKSVSEMNANIGMLKSSVDNVKSKVDDLVSWKHRIIGGAFVLGAFLSVFAFFVGKFWDYFSIKTPSPVSVQSTSSVTAQPTAPQPQVKN